MKLIWQKCQCGNKVCTLEYPTNLGRFYQGTGFDPVEKQILDNAFEAQSRLTKMAGELARAKHPYEGTGQ